MSAKSAHIIMNKPHNLKETNITIGDKKNAKLLCIMGLNVLENLELSLEVASELKSITSSFNLPFIFKVSFDKANRSSIDSYRGLSMKEGLKILKTIKQQLNIPLLTDIHELHQIEPVAEIVDVLQIPAFLCRQTDLVINATKIASRYGAWLHIKKAQFLAPWDVKNIITKCHEVDPDVKIILCERGTCFGYNNLVVDMLSIIEMQKLGIPVTIDATHSVQLPGADPRTTGKSTGGRREGVSVIAKAAIAAGADGVFLEFHPDPDKALCDAPSCLPLSDAKDLLATLKAIFETIRYI